MSSSKQYRHLCSAVWITLWSLLGCMAGILIFWHAPLPVAPPKGNEFGPNLIVFSGVVLIFTFLWTWLLAERICQEKRKPVRAIIGSTIAVLSILSASVILIVIPLFETPDSGFFQFGLLYEIEKLSLGLLFVTNIYMFTLGCTVIPACAIGALITPLSILSSD